MIETESNSPTPNRFAWLTPMVVMWSTVAMVIALIVLGTWLNNRRVLRDTHEVRQSFARILADHDFSAAQREALETQFEKTLAAASSGEARRSMSARIGDRLAAEKGVDDGSHPPAAQVFEVITRALQEIRDAK
jgi:hypothetical protein